MKIHYEDDWKQWVTQGFSEDACVEKSFCETYYELKKGNVDQTRGQTEHALCETFKGSNPIGSNSLLTPRDTHPDVMILRRVGPELAEVQHFYRRKERLVDSWKTTMFEMFVKDKWRRTDDVLLPPWFCSDFGPCAKYKRPWKSGYHGIPLVKKPAPWIGCGDDVVVPFPLPGRYVNVASLDKRKRKR